jgi:hypothetical protein
VNPTKVLAPVMYAASSDFSATNGPKVATPRRRCVASTAVTYRPGPPNRLSSFVSWLRKPSADIFVQCGPR